MPSVSALVRQSLNRLNRTQGKRQQRFDVVFYTPTVSALLRPGVSAPTGGAETQIYLLSQMMAKQGLNVALVAYDVPGGLPARVGDVTVVARPPYEGHRRRTGKVRETLHIWKILHATQAAVIVKRMCDVDACIVALYARFARRRYVYSSASVVDFTPEKILSKRRDQFLFNLGLRLADEIIVQTEEQMPMCEARFGRRPHLIKSIAEECPLSDVAPQAFIWIARLVPYKQPMAFVGLARAIPQAQFIMVGVTQASNDNSSRLYAEVSNAARDIPNLELADARPRNEIGALISRAVAIVNTGSFEGMPNVLLEGWSRGIPALVLHHDPGGVIQRYGLGAYAAGDETRFAELASEMWTRRYAREDLARRCREYVHREHSPDAVVKQWMNVMASLGSSPVGGAPGP